MMFTRAVRCRLSIAILVLSLVPCVSVTPGALQSIVADEVWKTDINAAIETAKSENKDLLLLYTGSDWCPPCKKLESEILSKPEFIEEVTKRFVLVIFDFPRNTPQDESVAEQNRKWAEKFGVDSYPTLFLIDKQLRPFAIAGYEDGGLQNYMGMLEESRQLRVKRDEKLAEADGKEGLERARLLDEAVNEIREEIVSLYYPEIVAEIVALDAEDELGLRTKWNARAETEMRKIVMTDVMMISRLEKPERAIEFIDEIMKEIEFPAKEKLDLQQIKLNLVPQLKDPVKTDALLDEMIAMEGVTPETRERLLVKKIYLMNGSGRGDEAMKLLNESLGVGHRNLFLLLAKGEILASKDQAAAAIETYDAAIKDAGNNPDILIELVSAKADAQFVLNQAAEALQTLDNFADNTQHPYDLRAEALLHKSMIMRDMNRVRQARLAENRAVEMAQSPQQRAVMQKMIEKLRAKFGE